MDLKSKPRIGETFNSLTISDIHLYNPRISNQKMIDALDDVLKQPCFKVANTIIFAGDYTDRRVTLDHPDNGTIIRGFARWCFACEEQDKEIWILEGTRSHDWGQMRTFFEMARIFTPNLKIRYFDKITVFKDERFDLDFLFVPDDIHHDHDVIFSMVEEQMQKANVQMVDFAIMHGMFESQVPEGLNLPCHKYENFDRIVRHAILIGHVHINSENGKMLAQGSFGRISHGEEQPKGYYHTWLDKEGVFHKQFIENKLAELFITVDCLGLTADQTFESVNTAILEYGSDVNIRIMSEAENPVFQNMDEMIRAFPMARFSTPKKIKPKESKPKIKLGDKLDKIFNVPLINRDNIGKLVLDRSERRGVSTPELLSAMTKVIETIR